MKLERMPTQGPTLQTMYSAVCCDKAPISTESESTAIWITLCASCKISPPPSSWFPVVVEVAQDTEKLLQDLGPIKSFLSSWAPFP